MVSTSTSITHTNASGRTFSTSALCKQKHLKQKPGNSAFVAAPVPITTQFLQGHQISLNHSERSWHQPHCMPMAGSAWMNLNVTYIFKPHHCRLHTRHLPTMGFLLDCTLGMNSWRVIKHQS
jgi:hypothetical protein